MNVLEWLKDLQATAENAVSSKPREFVPQPGISTDDLAYIMQHRLMDRVFSDKKWAEYPEHIRAHFK